MDLPLATGVDAERASGAAGIRFDLADLVGTLLNSGTPSREADMLVDVMLGGKEVVPCIDVPSVRAKLWLMPRVPEYTRGGGAINRLAHARGLVLSSEQKDGTWRVTATDRTTGRSSTVAHALEGVAGAAVIAHISAGG